MSQITKEDVEAGFHTFESSMGAKFAPYKSESNIRILMQWILDQCGESALATVGAWQLSFTNNLAKLSRDESHPVLQRQRAAEQAAFVSRVNSMSVAELKEAMREPVFSERYQRMNEEAQALQTFQGLTEWQIQDAIRFRPELKPVYQRFVEAGGQPVDAEVK